MQNPRSPLQKLLSPSQTLGNSEQFPCPSGFGKRNLRELRRTWERQRKVFYESERPQQLRGVGNELRQRARNSASQQGSYPSTGPKSLFTPRPLHVPNDFLKHISSHIPKLETPLPAVDLSPTKSWPSMKVRNVPALQVTCHISRVRQPMWRTMVASYWSIPSGECLGTRKLEGNVRQVRS